MPHRPDAACRGSVRHPSLAEQARRHAFLLEKLEREGYPCEIRDARRRLRQLEAKLPPAKRPRAASAAR
jgi:hypothetical protein